ncbi:protein pinocchio [Neocloeon triangulifer]|uniref:protein pinocchio n=1 Tax=Neocloeon triangulifer TaxID=2078957 RepID=UPI00286ECE5A|nr:protein pinocchio [Neocloeon triangulifer]XP_059472984.1 protein pinocchio [Neocloeon triangulifer]XP_059472985.1 protein pinocchio [Neocloeon triangulifer]
MMLRGPAVALTEYEDNILFDLDDPDFGANENCRPSSPAFLGMGLRRGSRSSCGSSASLVTLELPTTRERRCSGSSCASFDGDLAYLSIESLRSHLSSCFTCGVSWVEEHVSLDCPECGGYSMQRPCPSCDGRCESTWTRDLASSHASGKARWEGECSSNNCNNNQDTNTQARIILRSIVDLTLSDKMTTEKKTSS